MLVERTSYCSLASSCSLVGRDYLCLSVVAEGWRASCVLRISIDATAIATWTYSYLPCAAIAESACCRVSFAVGRMKLSTDRAGVAGRRWGCWSWTRFGFIASCGFQAHPYDLGRALDCLKDDAYSSHFDQGNWAEKCFDGRMYHHFGCRCHFGKWEILETYQRQVGWQSLKLSVIEAYSDIFCYLKIVFAYYLLLHNVSSVKI